MKTPTASSNGRVLTFATARTRRLKSWTDAFYQYTADKGLSPLVRRWAGIFTVAAALERRVWLKNQKGLLFPNLYVLIVGRAGAGKTLATSLCRTLLQEIEGHSVAPTSVTHASLIDSLVDSEKKIVRPQDTPDIITMNPLTVISDEFSVFLAAYENTFVSRLTTLYDGRVYRETRRTGKLDYSIEAPLLNMIAATTPSYLQNTLPAGVWEEGFMSRILMVFAPEEPPYNFLLERESEDATFADLIHDIRLIGAPEFYGPMTIEKDAADAFIQWHMAGGPPTPTHPRLLSYASRRSATLLKLCMVASASSSEGRTITLDHYVEALDWLMETEGAMPDIFKAMTTGGDSAIMRETWHFLYITYKKRGTPVPEPLLYQFVSERTPSYNVARLIEVMERNKLIEKKLWSNGAYGYMPMELREF